MRIGQLILLAGVVLFGLYVTRLRSRLTDRLAYLLLAVIGTALVINPEWSNRLAHLAGIGRGADLVFYLFIIFSLFYFVATSANRRRHERDLTTVVRTLALQTPIVGDPRATTAGGSASDVRGAAPDDGAAPSRRGNDPDVTEAAREQP
jgi:hypothetical protein